MKYRDLTKVCGGYARLNPNLTFNSFWIFPEVFNLVLGIRVAARPGWIYLLVTEL